jgi:hypothetical protein
MVTHDADWHSSPSLARQLLYVLFSRVGMYAARAGPLYVNRPTHVHYLICNSISVFLYFTLTDPVLQLGILYSCFPGLVTLFLLPHHIQGTLRVSYVILVFRAPHLYFSMSLVLVILSDHSRRL